MTRNLLAIILSTAVLAMFFGRQWIDPTLALAALFLLASGWAVALILDRRTLRFSFPMIPLACAVAWGALSGGSLELLTWAGNLVVFCLALRVGRPLLKPLLAFASVVCVLSVVQRGPFVNRDHYAAFIEMVLPLALSAAFTGRHTLRYAVISAAMYASVIACASRAGAVLTTAEIAILCGAGNLEALADLAVRRSEAPLPRSGALLGLSEFCESLNLARRRLLAGAVLAAIFVFIAGGAPLWHRLQDPDPFGGRREILASTLAMVRARPWTGFGLGTFQTVYPAYASIDFGAVVQHAHNDWAEWAAEGGIPFSLMILSIAIWSARKAWRAPWAIGAVAILVHALVDFPLHKPALELWLFALLGVTASPD